MLAVLLALCTLTSIALPVVGEDLRQPVGQEVLAFLKSTRTGHALDDSGRLTRLRIEQRKDEVLEKVASYGVESIVIVGESSDASEVGLNLLPNVAGLKSLSLSNLSFKNFVSVVARLTSLEHLELHDVPIGDEGLRMIGKLRKLRSLKASRIRMSTSGAEGLGDMQQLKALGIDPPGFTPAAIQRIAGLTNLEALTLDNSGATDKDLEVLNGHPTLALVSLENTRATPAGAGELKDSLTSPNAYVVGTSDPKLLEFLDARNVEHAEDNQGRVRSLTIGPGTDVVAVLERVRPIDALAEFNCPRLTASGMKLLPKASNLESVSLWDCDAAQLPAESFVHLAALPKLRSLRIWYPGDVEEVLGGLRDANSLRSVTIDTPRLTARGVAYLAEFPALTWLDLQNVQITPGGAKALGKLRNLKQLGVWDSQLGDEGLAAIGTLQGLKTLDLMGTAATPQGLASLHGLSKLQEFRLAHTMPSEATFRWLVSLQDLKLLLLEKMPLTDRDLEYFHGHPRLGIVILDNTRVSESGATALKESLTSDAEVTLLEDESYTTQPDDSPPQ
ncbi:MAG: hypothetical protein DWQ37_11595 [Planctomycetota bacterium]|nr:MAG: hypothetical protein DWQ37_11595 [Planctomycetota bacterium]